MPACKRPPNGLTGGSAEVRTDSPSRPPAAATKAGVQSAIISAQPEEGIRNVPVGLTPVAGALARPGMQPVVTAARADVAARHNGPVGGTVTPAGPVIRITNGRVSCGRRLRRRRVNRLAGRHRY
jgi:hypothetical protein